MTLAVRLGRRANPQPVRAADRRRLRGGAGHAAGDGRARLGAAWCCSSAPLVPRPLAAVMTRTDGPSLNGALAGTGALLAAFSALLAAGLVIAA